MVAFPILNRLTITPAALAAVVAAGTAAAVIVALPSHALESLVAGSGIAAFVPAAAPPLGFTARLLLTMLAGAAIGSLAWSIVTLLPRPRPRRRAPLHEVLASETIVHVPVPVLRRADAHPDAPPRAPLIATLELGTPFLDVRAKALPPRERDIPRNLEAPLSAYDPAAILDQPVAPVPPVAPLFRKPALDNGERFESFDLPRPAPLPLDERPIAAPRTEATIHALLERLERGVARRAELAPATSEPESQLQDTLSELRQLATR
jgi:hypothetical protein